eukprot:scaffold172844_cov31-Tisochrysis_lutea.AAC.3
MQLHEPETTPTFGDLQPMVLSSLAQPGEAHPLARSENRGDSAPPKVDVPVVGPRAAATS